MFNENGFNSKEIQCRRIKIVFERKYIALKARGCQSKGLFWKKRGLSKEKRFQGEQNGANMF